MVARPPRPPPLEALATPRPCTAPSCERAGESSPLARPASSVRLPPGGAVVACESRDVTRALSRTVRVSVPVRRPKPRRARVSSSDVAAVSPARAAGVGPYRGRLGCVSPIGRPSAAVSAAATSSWVMAAGSVRSQAPRIGVSSSKQRAAPEATSRRRQRTWRPCRSAAPADHDRGRVGGTWSRHWQRRACTMHMGASRHSPRSGTHPSDAAPHSGPRRTADSRPASRLT